MKLIDLLVQELPKRGGWPKGAEYARVTGFGGEKLLVDFLFPEAYNKLSYSIGIIACHLIDAGTDVDCHMIRRDSYESALATSQKPTWNGEGVPPVGCECEYSLNAGKTWWKCKIDYIVGTQGVVMLCDTFEGVQYVKFSSYGGTLKFRPIRTEADKKRDRICDAIYGALTKAERQHNRSDEAEAVYDAIAAGKIPGVKLED